MAPQKEADEAAKLYEDFVESFAEDPAEKGPKAFVRGEVIQPGQRPTDSGLLPLTCAGYISLLEAFVQCRRYAITFSQGRCLGVLESMSQSSFRLPWQQHLQHLKPSLCLQRYGDCLHLAISLKQSTTFASLHL